MPVEQAFVWLKTPAQDIPDARLYGFKVERRDGILLPFIYNSRRWVFSYKCPERDARSGMEIDWLVFTEHSA